MKKMKLFLVDDDRDFVESIVEVLEDKGYEVESAFSGAEALQRLSETDFDLTLMDVRMPGMNGVECLYEIRKTKPDIKVILMTAYSIQELLSRAIEEEAIGIPNKPFPVEDLLEILRREQAAPLILVADDDPDFVNSIKEILSENGYSIETARTGQGCTSRM